MSDPPRIDRDTTISELLRQRPAAQAVLRARGIDTCCGGELALGQAAAIREIPIGELLASLAPVHPEDNIRDVLASHPATYVVFERHGLMGCGGPAGPDERIDFFARVHNLDLAVMIDELNTVVLGGEPPPVAPPAVTAVPATVRPGRLPMAAPAASPAKVTLPGVAAARPRAVFSPFLRAALWSTITLGATFGAINLLAIDFALGRVLEAHNFVHAGFQIWGFVLLFTMGISYHAVPRFLGTDLRLERLARSTFPLALGGLLLVTYGRFGHWFPGALWAFAAGAGCTFAAVAAWGYVLLDVAERSRSAPQPFHRFLVAGTVWWVVAAGLLGAAATRAVAHGGVEYAARFHEAMYAAALFGASLAWVQGMFLRTGPAFFGLPPTRRRPVKAAFLLGQAGALVAVGGALVPGWRHSHDLVALGLIATAASLVAYVVGVRPFRIAPDLTPGDRGVAEVIRLGFAGALLFALLGACYGVHDLAIGTPSRLIFDGARHAFGLGFLTLMILGMAGRVVPVFCGVDLRWRHLHTWGARLVALGVCLREAQVLVAVLAAPRLLWVSGVSGIVAASGVCLAAASILGTLRAGRRLEAAVAVPGEDAAAVPISGEANVARLIAAHAEALPLLIQAGFTPLANPVLRRTLARAVTLAQACRMHGIEVDPLVARIRAACSHPAAVK
jgi:hypothetical protein